MADADCLGDSERWQCKCCQRRRRNRLRIRGSVQSRIQEDDGDPAFNLAAPRWSWLVALTIERNWLAANRWIRRDVRFGSLADILCSGSHVRFAPESRHLQRTNSCPLSANSGHGRRQHYVRRGCITQLLRLLGRVVHAARLSRDVSLI